MSPQLAIYLLWFLWVASWFAAAFWTGRTQKRASLKDNLIQRAVVLLGVVLLFGLYSPRPLALHSLWTLSDAWGWAMAALVFAGLAFCWWARIHLGRLWSSNVGRKEDHYVVQSGPYAWVRHPIYSGIMLASFATAAQMGTMAALAGAAIMALGWYVKARMEERFLRAELGPAYAAYAERVAMLIPFVRF
jgi:protein-S-isoprenylcysteine O-methyltransferase Ste14